MLRHPTVPRISGGTSVMNVSRHPLVIVAAVALWTAASALAQDEPRFATWAKAEAADEAKKYVEQLKKGEFDAAAQAFLEQIALPQLAIDGNRKTIERKRRRMREVLLNEKLAEAAALEKASRAAVDWLVAQARNPQVDPAVRVNAMLFVGELRGKDGRPWPGATAALSGAAADAKLPEGVRVAAVAGLARQVDAARLAGGGDPQLAQATAKSLLTIIAAAPSATDGAASDWLVSRALDMAAVVMPQATPEAAAAIVAILDDASRAVDVRVRAAAALGTMATADATINAARAVAAIRGLAVEAVKADLATAAERAIAARMSGQPVQGMMPGGIDGGGVGFPGGGGFPGSGGFPGGGGEFGGVAGVPDDPIDALVVRRDAWRLMTLANAVEAADGSRGLATLLAADAADGAKTIAKVLREAAVSLDQSPDATSLKQALAAIERVAPAAAGPAVPKPAAAAGDPPAAGGVPAAANDPFNTGN
jgi:glutaredoxin